MIPTYYFPAYRSVLGINHRLDNSGYLLNVFTLDRHQHISRPDADLFLKCYLRRSLVDVEARYGREFYRYIRPYADEVGAPLAAKYNFCSETTARAIQWWTQENAGECMIGHHLADKPNFRLTGHYSKRLGLANPKKILQI